MPPRSALTNTNDHGAEQLAQILLTADGMALLPVVTAIIVGARLTGRVRGEPKPGDGYVIVVGGGEVGVRVMGGLFDLGFHAVLIDQDHNARAVEFARGRRLPVIIGDACDEKTLRQAGIKTAIALVCVTSSDIVNLETALQARAMRDEDLRIVLRLFDDDLAGRVHRKVANVVSRSVSYLAAPAFAAALLEHRVLRTIAVGRHVLLIADVRVEPGASILGRCRWRIWSGTGSPGCWHCRGAERLSSTGRPGDRVGLRRMTGSSCSPLGRGFRHFWREIDRRSHRHN